MTCSILGYMYLKLLYNYHIMRKISTLIVLLVIFVGYTHAQIGAKHLLTFEQASNSFYSGDPEGAMGILESNSMDLAEGKDQLLYELFKGTILSEMGKYSESNQYFDKAYQTIDAFGADVGKKGLSMLTNPLVTNYEGEAAEQMLIHYFKIYNYLRMGESQSAIGEVNKMNARIADLESKKGKKTYIKDALLHIMIGIAYEQNGQFDNAYSSYKEAYDLYQTNYDVNFDVKAPEQLKKDLVRAAKLSNNETALNTYMTNFGITNIDLDPSKGQVVVLWKNGQAAKKLETKMTMQPTQMNGGLGFINTQTGEQFPAGAAAAGAGISRLLGGGPTTMAYPYYAPKAEKYTNATVSVGDVSSDLHVAEDVSKILIQSLSDKKLREIGSMLARSLTKNAGKALAKKGLKRAAAYIPGVSSFSGMINKGIDKAVDKAASKSEHADTRGWYLLPHKIHYTRLDLPAGEQTINFSAKDATGLTSDQTQSVNITAGKIAVVSFSVTESGAVVTQPAYAAATSTSTIGTGLSGNSMLIGGGASSSMGSEVAIDYFSPMPAVSAKEIRQRFLSGQGYYTRVEKSDRKLLKHGIKNSRNYKERLFAKYYLDENGISSIDDKVYFDFQMGTKGRKKISGIKDLPGFVKELMYVDLKTTLYPNLTKNIAEADYILTVNVQKLKASNNLWFMFVVGVLPTLVGFPGELPTFKIDYNATLKNNSGDLIAQSYQSFKKKGVGFLYNAKNKELGFLAPKKNPNKLNVIELGMQKTVGDMKRDLYTRHINYKN